MFARAHLSHDHPTDLEIRLTVRRIVAWCAHLYTALGLVAAAGIAVLIVRRGRDDFRAAFVLMFVATAIDATDGSLARWARVREVTPSFDGRRLDDIIDFHTYTTLPLLLIWRSDVLPSHLAGWLLLPLLASAYGFSQAEAKTEDRFFLGFPRSGTSSPSISTFFGRSRGCRSPFSSAWLCLHLSRSNTCTPRCRAG